MYFHVQNYSSHWHIAPREIAVDAAIITEKRFLVPEGFSNYVPPWGPGV